MVVVASGALNLNQSVVSPKRDAWTPVNGGTEVPLFPAPAEPSENLLALALRLLRSVV